MLVRALTLIIGVLQFPEFNRQDGTHFGALSDYIGSEYILLFPKTRIELVRRGIWRHQLRPRQYMQCTS